MLTILPRTTVNPDTRTVQFQGREFGTELSFFLIDCEPGQGPALPQHPYAEMWVTMSGRALVVAGDEEREVGPEDMVIVGPDTPHRFVALGPDRLNVICLHDAGEMITEWL